MNQRGFQCNFCTEEAKSEHCGGKEKKNQSLEHTNNVSKSNNKKKTGLRWTNIKSAIFVMTRRDLLLMPKISKNEKDRHKILEHLLEDRRHETQGL